jgi:hypothetical protein
MRPFDSTFLHNNAPTLLRIGQVELLVGLGILFALLSLVIWRIRGRGVSYFISQFLGLAFIILATGILFERVASARLAHHIRLDHGIRDNSYPELFGPKPSR